MTVTTTNNGIPLQGLGDSLNSWGIDSSNGLNNALSLLENLCSGVETVSLTGNVTLTTTAKADNQARNIGFILTDGGLSAAPTITVPSIEGVYLCFNAGSTYTITITCSGSATTASVPPGTLISVISDGTDCFGGIFRLDQLAAPTSSVAMGSQKITGLATGTASTDAVNKGQVDLAIAGAGVAVTSGAVKITSSDTTGRFLGDAIVAGEGMSGTVNNSGGDETLTIDVDIAGTTAVMTTEASDEVLIYDDSASSIRAIVLSNLFNKTFGQQAIANDQGDVSSGTVTISKTSADEQTIRLQGDVTIDFTAPDSGFSYSKVLIVDNDSGGSGGRDITWNRAGGTSNIYHIGPEPAWSGQAAGVKTRVGAHYTSEGELVLSYNEDYTA
jgi:hypothetical protein